MSQASPAPLVKNKNILGDSEKYAENKKTPSLSRQYATQPVFLIHAGDGT